MSTNNGGNYPLNERVSEFKYLGTPIHSKNDITSEINNRIIAGNRCVFGLSKLLKSKYVLGAFKLRLYNFVPFTEHNSPRKTL